MRHDNRRRIPHPLDHPWAWGGLRPSPTSPGKEKASPRMAVLTPAFLCSCFCRGSRPAMRGAGPVPRGPGALLSAAIRGGSCAPAVSREPGASCTRGSAPHRVPVLSAGDVFQLPLPLRGAGLLPGPGAAASRGRRWHPAYVHSQGKGLGAPTAPLSWSAPCSESLREDLPCVRPQWDAGDGAWALPSGLQGEVQRIHLGEIRSFREDVTRESRLREQKGFQ